MQFTFRLLPNYVARGILTLGDYHLNHRIALRDSIDNILSLSDLTKYGVPAIQVRLWRMAYKELAAIGTGTRIRHRQ